VFIFCYFATVGFSQQKMLPQHVYFKDQFVRLSKDKSITTLYPANESQLNLHHINRDSSLQYYEVFDWLFKKHWVEIRNKQGHLSISPLVDGSFGKEQIDTTRSTLLRNTRGVFVEGQLLDKFSFSFSFAENQAQFMEYETRYLYAAGEKYVSNGGYLTTNAVIPGAARTKPFKENGFDYAYSIGSVRYAASKVLSFEAGNNGHFVGNGYRSLLLSDHSTAAPYVKADWKFAPRWTYSFIAKRTNNLYRKPVYQTVEAPYENKLFTVAYLSFKASEQFTMSLFTAGANLRGDSLVKHPLQASMWIPVPGLNTDLFQRKNSTLNGIAGINLDYALKKQRIYGQVVIDKVSATHLFAGQLGVHFFDLANIPNLHVQSEINYVPPFFYASENPKLAYSHYQLPSAHPRGNNFLEGIIRMDYEYKRFFLQSKSILQQNQGIEANAFAPHSIFTPVKNLANAESAYGSTFIQEIEVGYRVNRKYNGMILVGCKIRSSEFKGARELNQAVYLSIKSGLLNHYFDF
jgi:hypothetical protein